VAAPTAHNLLRTLVQCGLAGRQGKRYVLGPAVLSLAQLYGNRQVLRRAVTAVRSLSRALAHATVTFAVPAGQEVTIRLRMSPERQGVLQKPVAQTLNLYRTASGVVVYTFADGETLQAIREKYPFCEEGVQLWKSKRRLERFIEKVRAEGYADFPFREDEGFRVAAPVFGADHEFVGACGVRVPAKALRRGAKKQKTLVTRTLVQTTAGLAA